MTPEALFDHLAWSGRDFPRFPEWMRANKSRIMPLLTAFMDEVYAQTEREYREQRRRDADRKEKAARKAEQKARPTLKAVTDAYLALLPKWAQEAVFNADHFIAVYDGRDDHFWGYLAPRHYRGGLTYSWYGKGLAESALNWPADARRAVPVIRTPRQDMHELLPTGVGFALRLPTIGSLDMVENETWMPRGKRWVKVNDDA